MKEKIFTMPKGQNLSRRRFTLATLAVTAGAPALFGRLASAADLATQGFRLRYILSSSMYGCADLEAILGEVKKTGTKAIDIWPLPHGNQREQIEQMGENRFAGLLKKNGVSLGCITQYKLGPFGLQEEMRFANRLGCSLIVTGGHGPKGLAGNELKKAVQKFAEQMKPHLEVAQQTGVTIAIENHGNNLIESPDSMKWLVELCPSDHLGIALAPYHLLQNPKRIAGLIRSLGNRIKMFYAWQHGMGSSKKMPKEQELLQMPGRGSLDFGPIVKALQAIDYSGFTSIFMHPVPRGIPILEPTSAVTKEINHARAYLDSFISQA
jgi:sugar phosphate isomerase/epimerase